MRRPGLIRDALAAFAILAALYAAVPYLPALASALGPAKGGTRGGGMA